MRRATTLVGGLAVAVLVAGLALGQAGLLGRSGGGSANSQASTSPSVATGAALYAANCQTCHGAKGQGGKYRGVGSEAARRGFSRFKSLILYGSERMPGYLKSGLSTSNNLGTLGANGYLGNSTAPSNKQVSDLLAYLQTLPARGGRGFGGDD